MHEEKDTERLRSYRIAMHLIRMNRGMYETNEIFNEKIQMLALFMKDKDIFKEEYLKYFGDFCKNWKKENMKD